MIEIGEADEADAWESRATVDGGTYSRISKLDRIPGIAS